MNNYRWCAEKGKCHNCVILCFYSYDISCLEFEALRTALSFSMKAGLSNILEMIFPANTYPCIVGGCIPTILSGVGFIFAKSVEHWILVARWQLMNRSEETPFKQYDWLSSGCRCHGDIQASSNPTMLAQFCKTFWVKLYYAFYVLLTIIDL